MSKYSVEVYEVFEKLAGNKKEQILATANKLEQLGTKPERALADALFHYGKGGAVKNRRKK